MIEVVPARFPLARVVEIAALCSVAAVVFGCSLDSDPLAAIRELHSNKKFKQSIEPLRAMLDENPDQPAVSFLLGLALMRTGDSSSAIWPLRRAMESPEFVVEAGLMVGRAELASRTPRDVINAVEFVLNVEPDNVEALVIRAQAYLKAKREEDALGDLSRVVELDPENIHVLVPRVLALMELERIDEAEQALATAKEVLEATDQEVKDQHRGRLCVANGLFAFEKGDTERAAKLYEECLEAYPTVPLVVFQSVAQFDRLEQPERATEVLRAAFEQSKNSNFRNALAARMNRLGEHEETERLLRDEAEERSSVQAWFGLADYYVLRDEFDKACEAFERALAVEKTPVPMVRFGYVDTLIQAERFEDAEREMARVEQEHMRDLLTGRLLLKQGDPSGALRAFEAGLRLWPNNGTARFLAGQAAEQIGDFDRAIEEYREALRRRRKRGETDAGLYLARILAAKGSHRGAVTVLYTFLESHPKHAETLLLLIRSAHELALPKAISEAMTRLSVSGSSGLAMAEQIAIMAEESGSQAAIDSADASGLDLSDPANVVALRALLAQHEAVGQHSEGRARIAAALELHPDEAAFHDLAARALRADGGGHDEVRALFERSLELEPDNARALAGLAEVSAAAGARDEAIALYDRATAADPEDVAPARAAISLLQSAGQTEAAQQRLAALIVQDPRDASAANALARSLAETGGDLDRALSYAKRAAYFTTVDEAAETLGWIHLLRGEFDTAVEVLAAAVESRPEASSARYRLGLALAAQGERARAREAFDAVIRAGGAESEQARTEIARLDQAAASSAAQ